MPWTRYAVAALALVIAGSLSAAPASGPGGGLHAVGQIELPGVEGRIDHFAIDVEHRRLYVAALGANEVEVVDLDAGKRVARLQGLPEVQGLAFAPASQRLFVAVGGSGKVVAFEHDKQVASAGGLPDADNMRLSPSGDRLFVGYGDGLAVLDPQSLRIVDKISLPGHPEAFELAARGAEIYVNVPEAAQVVVVDQRAGMTTTSWSVKPEAANFPMAIDEAGQRLYVGTRRPAGLLVFDTATGHRLSAMPLCGDVDDLFLDSQAGSLFAICGEGRVDVFIRRDAGGFEAARQVATAPGARTGLFVPSMRLLFVAAPARSAGPARLMMFRAE
jgi:hypothetical protein